MCWRYQSLTAAIASATIECQGTIGPGSFKVDGDGNLTPTFTSCIPGATKAKAANAQLQPSTAAPAPAAPAPAALAPAPASPAAAAKAPPAGNVIAQVPPPPQQNADEVLAKENYELLISLLAFQKAPDLPNIHECLGKRWTRWTELFKRTNIASCPTWEKTEVIGAPQFRQVGPNDPPVNVTALQTGKMQPRLPVAPEACSRYNTPEERRDCVRNSIREQFQKQPELRTEQTYVEYVLPPKTSATYTVTVPPNVQCDDAGVCAAQCASAFPGFVLAASGNRVDGDATYWLNPDPPFTYRGYQHPMAQWNGPPGDVYGHINRVGEQCWRWDPFDGYWVMTLIDAHLPGLSHCGDF
jgi:hypothetical protein